jgi:hypothetical protein
MDQRCVSNQGTAASAPQRPRIGSVSARHLRGLTIVVVQQASQTLPAANWATRIRPCSIDYQAVSNPLMIAFEMIMAYELSDGLAQTVFSKDDEPVQTGLFDGANEPFRMGVQIRRAPQVYSFSCLFLKDARITRINKTISNQAALLGSVRCACPAARGRFPRLRN